MRPLLVVVLSTRLDLPARIEQVLKPARVQTLVPQFPVKTLHMRVLHWLAGLDGGASLPATGLRRTAACAPQNTPLKSPRRVRVPDAPATFSGNLQKVKSVSILETHLSEKETLPHRKNRTRIDLFAAEVRFASS
jgi:hypothetical protein